MVLDSVVAKAVVVMSHFAKNFGTDGHPEKGRPHFSSDGTALPRHSDAYIFQM